MPAETHTAGHPAFVEALIARLDLRANSLIITIFGDAIMPRGGTAWLGSLIGLASCFGISERLVRTGVYRLAREGWLASRSRGRRSYYSLTPAGHDKFEEAQRRIYAAGPLPWDDNWRLVQILPDMSQAERQALRRELTLLGMGQVSPTLFAHPSADGRIIHRTLDELGLTTKVIALSAAMENYVQGATVRRLAREAWSLDALGRDYEAFEEHFREVPELLDKTPGLSVRDHFTLRILLIHDYRRILLKDPQLPDDLLPADWQGRQARELCARIYRRVAGPAEGFIDAEVETWDGAPPPAGEAFWGRFGGVPGAQIHPSVDI
jgi:phenylacetic acid degradation operon negative regulatory protein